MNAADNAAGEGVEITGDDTDMLDETAAVDAAKREADAIEMGVGESDKSTWGGNEKYTE